MVACVNLSVGHGQEGLRTCMKGFELPYGSVQSAQVAFEKEFNMT